MYQYDAMKIPSVTRIAPLLCAMPVRAQKETLPPHTRHTHIWYRSTSASVIPVFGRNPSFWKKYRDFGGFLS